MSTLLVYVCYKLKKYKSLILKSGDNMKNISLEINGFLFDKMSVAETYHDMVHGLENRQRLNNNEGMIYVFSKDYTGDFINENPYLDIDVIMVDAYGKITAVHCMKKAVLADGEAEKEHFEKSLKYKSNVPCRYVFEFKAGTIQTLGAKAGERLDVDYTRLYPFKNAENIRYAFQLKKVSVSDDWKLPLLRRMKKFADSPDALQKLNLDFAGGILDQDILLAENWIRLDNIDLSKTYNAWFQKDIYAAGQKICVTGKQRTHTTQEWLFTDGVNWQKKPEFLN